MQAGYWDTRMGMKQQADSYRRIMQQMGVEQAQRLLFLTDVEAEARACRQAGGQAMVVVREGNKTERMCHVLLSCYGHTIQLRERETMRYRASHIASSH